MYKIRIRCKKCNSYTEFDVAEDNYFKWMSTNNPDDLKLHIDDEILFIKEICNKCRLEERRLSNSGK